jgi:simple sugar transport system ATP-binding protein
VGGEPVANASAAAVIRQGVAHVPEDRTSVGSAPNLSLTDNLIMKRYRDAPVARGWLVDDGSARSIAGRLRETYRIASPTIDTEVRLLSGGNLQRAILAREIETNPGLLIAVQPTRGLDVGAIESVHRLLIELRSQGTAIVLISEELDEVLALADRVEVMYEGRFVGSFDRTEAEIGRIGLLMTGGADGDGNPVSDGNAHAGTAS